jgi:predicted nucleic acid-binding protein
MNAAVRDCLVTGYEPLIGAVELPDPDDRHVLAAAIRARAQVIVTETSKTSRPRLWKRGTWKRSLQTTSSSIK